MNVFGQILVLLSVTVLGEAFAQGLNLPLPGNVVGMLCLAGFLVLKWVKEAHIQDVGDFLLKNMAFLFIPAGVSILENIALLEGKMIRLLIVCIGTTVITLVVTGFTAQWVIGWQSKKQVKQEGDE